jgi:uncharacterized membrane protein
MLLVFLAILMLLGGGILMGIGSNMKDKKKHDGMVYGGLVMFILAILLGLYLMFSHNN